MISEPSSSTELRCFFDEIAIYFSLLRPHRSSVTCPQGAVSGIAVGGVLTSGLSFASQLTAADSGDGAHTAEDVAPAAFLYFASSAVVIAACILGYSALPLLPYGRCGGMIGYKLLHFLGAPSLVAFLSSLSSLVQPLPK